MTATPFLRQCVFGVLILSFGLQARADKVTASFPPVDSEPLGTVSSGAIVLHDKWQMREEAIMWVTTATPFPHPRSTRRIGIRQPCPPPPLRLWLRNGIYPDPIMGMNMMKIPDVNAAENTRYDLLQVQPPAGSLKSRSIALTGSALLSRCPPVIRARSVWLHLDGINYRADVWLNGHQIANAQDVVGHVQALSLRHQPIHEDGRSATNSLAIRIHQLDVPGDPVLEQIRRRLRPPLDPTPATERFSTT